MHQIASRHDFRNLSEEQQTKHEDLLRLLQQESLSCRCVMVGKDFTVVVGPGYASPKWWMDRFGVNGHSN